MTSNHANGAQVDGTDESSALENFIRAMPKVELHVHLEGAIQPQTLLELAQRNRKQLPADTVEGLRDWYTFSDFSHFVQIYLAISSCICTPDDIELVAREFLTGQAAQNIRYSEVTYTAFTHYFFKGLAFADQLAALNRARDWAAAEHDVRMNLILDIPRLISPEEGLTVADWAIEGMSEGVVALGLGGPERDNPPERYAEAFDRARAAGLASVPHAGETVGPESIWGALRELHAVRIGHGVRCLEDAQLVDYLRVRAIPLEVCPTSNVCLHVVPTFEDHPLPRLLAEGLYVTINSDDPPLFNTTLTDEYLKIARAFELEAEEIQRLVMNGVGATLLVEDERKRMKAEFEAAFAGLSSSGAESI